MEQATFDEVDPSLWQLYTAELRENNLMILRALLGAVVPIGVIILLLFHLIFQGTFVTITVSCFMILLMLFAFVFLWSMVTYSVLKRPRLEWSILTLVDAAGVVAAWALVFAR